MQEPADWRTSSYSASTGNCVEVGTAPDAIVVCDTKNREAGALRVSLTAWRRFAVSLKETAISG